MHDAAKCQERIKSYAYSSGGPLSKPSAAIFAPRRSPIVANGMLHQLTARASSKIASGREIPDRPRTCIFGIFISTDRRITHSRPYGRSGIIRADGKSDTSQENRSEGSVVPVPET